MTRFGPGLLVTAAFIGPGTVTTASVAGAEFGFALLWALLFSIVATLVLQEMAARVGLVTGGGLSEALRKAFERPTSRLLAGALVVAAIGVGNAAFQTGNLTGAALGLASLFDLPIAVSALVVGAVAFTLLFSGRYRVVERALIGLVAIMSVVFLLTALIVGPDLGALAGGLFVPAVPEGSLLTVVALIGTTVVPYNLFLHAAAVNETWRGVPLDRALHASRTDAALSISLGGLITLAIVATAASAFFAEGIRIDSAATMARQLEPLLGPSARYLFAAGLLAAGVTSAVTAPLAAAYAIAGVFAWPADLRDSRLRAVWITVVVIGTVLAAAGTRPVAAIVFAQAANGILLPVVAVLLLAAVNRRDLLGEHRNGALANLLGAAVVIIAATLGLFQLARSAGIVSS